MWHIVLSSKGPDFFLLGVCAGNEVLQSITVSHVGCYTSYHQNTTSSPSVQQFFTTGTYHAHYTVWYRTFTPFVKHRTAPTQAWKQLGENQYYKCVTNSAGPEDILSKGNFHNNYCLAIVTVLDSSLLYKYEYCTLQMKLIILQIL